MITESEYKYHKQIIEQYEEEKRALDKIKGKSKCPFCSGTKVKPFIEAFRNQDCTDCDKEGMISNKVLYTIGLEDCIEKIK